MRHLLIVALTSLAMKSDHDNCLQAGADEFLTKPVKLSHLATTIQQQVNKSRNSRALLLKSTIDRI